MKKSMNISVIGLGKLGACTAACFAYKGYNVIGVDINTKVVELINAECSPYIEPGLEKLLKNCDGRLKAVTNYEEAINNTNITFLILPTPSEPNGEFSDKYLKNALYELSKIFREKNSYHTFVVVSTVSPGTNKNSIIPFIELASGKKLNKDFGVVYNPEFIALGSVIKDFLNPDMVLIGESSKKDGDLVESIYRNVCENSPYFARMNIISAEITKISLNSFVTMKISFANTLGNICEKVPDANVDNITNALGSDKRISPYYLKAGSPYGGPCFPRDNRAFAAFTEKFGIDAKLAKATDEINDFQTDKIVKSILMNLPVDRKISIIGLTYKEGTPVLDESLGMKLINKLSNNIAIYVFDDFSHIYDNSINFPNNVILCDSLEKCLNSTSLHIPIIIKNNYEIIKYYYSTIGREIKILDIWRIFDNINNKLMII
ncbi:UDP-glucose/GDP-mannose dehydrogenase family protein [Deferribacteraceae bacterium V6Fe1]|nr:UDP-glucose/GDP-mannose dehydrogenase family protein [Deferribacteraceae bacterium V6Fe1]